MLSIASIICYIGIHIRCKFETVGIPTVSNGRAAVRGFSPEAAARANRRGQLTY